MKLAPLQTNTQGFDHKKLEELERKLQEAYQLESQLKNKEKENAKLIFDL